MFFAEKNINYIRIDLALTISHKSIFTMLEKAITGTVNQIQTEVLIEQCYQKLYEKSNNKFTYIVLDNLERISSKKSIKEEIITLIQLLEDAEFNKYKIRFILVGIPSSLKEFFSEIEYFEPIANRISEVTKLNGFSNTELLEFLESTFTDKLHFDILETQLSEIKEYTMQITDGMPLRVQQFLLLLAEGILENQKVYVKQLLAKSAKKLLDAHYSEIETIADEFFLEPTNRVQRRNQLIFILGNIEHNVFTLKNLQVAFKRLFPLTTKGEDLQVNRYILPLTKGEKPLVKKIDKKRFRINNGNIKIWINSILYIESGTEIVRKNN